MIAIRRFASEEAWLAAIEADFLEILGAAAPGPVALCLAGGATPGPAYRRLAAALLRDFPVREGHTGAPAALLVVGDERDGAIEGRYRNDETIKAAWSEALTAGRARLMRWERSPAEPAAMERRLAELAASRAIGVPLFDLCYLGLGADCHTAGLFPGDPSLAPALVSALPAAFETERRAEIEAREAGSLGEAIPRALRGRAPDYPYERLSLSFAALRSSRRTRFLVRSAGKESALAALTAGDPSCPAVRAAAPDALAFVLD
jgi:6-phosphogluconolactonase